MKVSKKHIINEHHLKKSGGRIRTILDVNGNEQTDGQFYYIYREILWPEKTEWELFVSDDGKIKLRPMEMLEIMSIMAKVHADFIARKMAKIREKRKQIPGP
jgi:hypothetical protein